MSVDNAVKTLRKWQRQKQVKRIFLNNYSDTFHEQIPFAKIKEWHDRIIEAFPDFTLQLLTKRIGRAMVYYREHKVPDNVWIGCTIGAPDKLWRLNQLRKIDARLRWISCEPLLGDLTSSSTSLDLSGIGWVVCGGESDARAPRPMKPEWAIRLSQSCKDQGIPFFFKQRGGRGGDNAGGNICPCCEEVHQEFPKVAR